MNKRNKIILTIASLTCFIILGVTFKSKSDPNSQDTVNPGQEKAADGIVKALAVALLVAIASLIGIPLPV